jgi:hypothetical protein
MKLQGVKYETIPVLNVLDLHELKAIFEKFPFEYISIPCV